MPFSTAYIHICHDSLRYAVNSLLISVGSNVSVKDSNLPTPSTKCLVREDSIESYHEYDYCELADRQNTPTNEVAATTTVTNFNQSNLDREQDIQYLRYYLQHVHTICDTVKLHVSRMQDILANNSQSNQTIVSHSKVLVSTAHKLVFIGDSLCRSVRQASTQTAISDDANALCNALKDFIMITMELARSSPATRPTALAKLSPSVMSIELRTESFRNMIASHIV